MGNWRTYSGPLKPALLLLGLCGIIHLRHGPHENSWMKVVTLSYSCTVGLVNIITGSVVLVACVLHFNVLVFTATLYGVMSMVYTVISFWFCWSKSGLHKFLKTASILSKEQKAEKICTTRTKLNVVTCVLAIAVTIYEVIMCVNGLTRSEQFSDVIFHVLPEWIRYEFGKVYFISLMIPNATRLAGPLMFTAIAVVIQDEFIKLKILMAQQLHLIELEDNALAPDAVKCILSPCSEARMDAVLTSAKAHYERLCDVVNDVNRYASVFLGLSCLLHIISVCFIMYNSLFPEFLGAFFVSGVYDALCVLFLCLPPALLNATARSLENELHRIPLSNISDRVLHKVNNFLLRIQGSSVGFTMMGIFTIDEVTILTIYATIITYVVIALQVGFSSRSTSCPVCPEMITWNNVTGT